MKTDQGSAVVASLAVIWVSTLLFTSTLGVIFSGYNLLLVREVAVAAAREGALAEKSAPEAESYALKLLRESIPRLASHQVKAKSTNSQFQVEIESKLLGIGFLENLIQSKVTASATKETPS